MSAQKSRPAHKPSKIAPADLLRSLSSKRRDAMLVRFDDVLAALSCCLGEPYYAGNGFILYQGDCVQLLSEVAQSSVALDLCVTSPPYNIGKEYESPLSLEDYLVWSERWMHAVHAASSDCAAFWLNLGYLEIPGIGKRVPLPYLLWEKVPFYLQQEVVWQYGAGVSSSRRFAPRNEKWLFYTRHPSQYVFNLDDVRDPNVKYPNQKKNGKLRCNPLGKNPGDVWAFPKVTSGRNRSSKERTKHPAQFPLAVVNDVIKVSSNPGDLVVDPFSGSGSTGIAAVGNGRVYLGFEIREDYCELSVERFRRFELERQELKQQQVLPLQLA